MELQLSPQEVRVLGVLMEKAATTPETYPLTLNSLTLGCNQKTSRDPVVEYDEDEVLAALDSLRDLHLVLRVDMAGSRVPKYRHRVPDAWELETAEAALLTVLFLRGPQTVGQLRQRAERMHVFRDLDEAKACLEGLAQRELEPTPLVSALPVRPGSKEVRYAHSLRPLEAAELAAAESGDASADPAAPRPKMRAAWEDPVEALQARVDGLESELRELRDAFDAFRAQF